MPRLAACFALAAVAALGLVVAPGAAVAKARNCGRITVSERKFVVYKLRGVECAVARRAARAAEAGRPRSPWRCRSGIGHRYAGSEVSLICGHGGSGALMKRPHAFLTLFVETYP